MKRNWSSGQIGGVLQPKRTEPEIKLCIISSFENLKFQGSFFPRYQESINIDIDIEFHIYIRIYVYTILICAIC